MARSFLVLKRRSDFRRTYGRGRSWANKLLVLYLASDPGACRVGFSVSRKVGKAVVRNRVRRRLKEACHVLLIGTQARGNAIVIARTTAATASYQDLLGALCDLLRRARVLC